ncbi:hypothetical protein SRHO_G00084480 [Serrasalmus rhombeus]
MLKPQIQKGVPTTLPRASPPPVPMAAADTSGDGDLWLLVSETIPPVVTVPSSSAGLYTVSPVGVEQVLGASAVQEGPQPLDSSLSQPCPSLTLRRTARSTAGQHSNIHRLPCTENAACRCATCCSPPPPFRGILLPCLRHPAWRCLAWTHLILLSGSLFNEYKCRWLAVSLPVLVLCGFAGAVSLSVK